VDRDEQKREQRSRVAARVYKKCAGGEEWGRTEHPGPAVAVVVAVHLEFRLVILLTANKTRALGQTQTMVAGCVAVDIEPMNIGSSMMVVN